MIRFYSIVFLSSCSLAAAAFWHFVGRLLDYNVSYGNDDGWTEHFATPTRIGITLVVAFLLGALVTWLIHAYRHDYGADGSCESKR